MFSRPEIAIVIPLFPTYMFAIEITRISEGLDLEPIYFKTSILFYTKLLNFNFVMNSSILLLHRFAKVKML